MASALGIRRSTSLLPYLQGSQANACLKFSLLQSDPPDSDDAYPFGVLDDTPPVSRLIEARFLTDTGSILKKVVLQVQKDRYALSADELRSVTNLDIDASWQEAFSAIQLDVDGMWRMQFYSQPDTRERLIPFTPLFFCCERGLFFHPACPSCGLLLTLCTDDELLKRTGLTPYTTSLKRYLHCDDCCSHGLSEFYLYESDSADSVTVKDRWELIDRFRLIDDCMDPDGIFPCVRCHERKTCYSPTPRVRTRVTPFTFYPFYLLMSDAPSLHGVDFLHLVSGARAEELADRLDPERYPGRVSRLGELRAKGALGKPLLECGDGRAFLEILFLKLSYLSNLLQQFRWNDYLQEARLRSHRVWVHLPAVSQVMPRYWNFSVEMVDDITPTVSGAKTMTPPYDALTHLGLFWIQVLCQNAKLSLGGIFTAVSGWLARRADLDISSPRCEGLGSILAPENIFWNPECTRVREEWCTLWDRACAPVYLLLHAAQRNDPGISRDMLIKTVEVLRSEIRSAIFAPAPFPSQSVVAPAPGSAVEPGSSEGALRAILSTLVEKARCEIRSASSLERHLDDETMETVILPPQACHPGRASSPYLVTLDETYVKPQLSLQETCDGMLETMLAAPSRPAQFQPPWTNEAHRPMAFEPAQAVVVAEAEQIAESARIKPQGMQDAYEAEKVTACGPGRQGNGSE